MTLSKGLVPEHSGRFDSRRSLNRGCGFSHFTGPDVDFDVSQRTGYGEGPVNIASHCNIGGTPAEFNELHTLAGMAGIMKGRTAKCIECFNIPHEAMELPEKDYRKVVAGLVKTAEGGFPKDSLTSQASIGPFQEAAVMAITAVWYAPPSPPSSSNTGTTARTPARPNSAETGCQDSMLIRDMCPILAN